MKKIGAFIKFTIEDIISSSSLDAAVEGICCSHGLDREALEIKVIGGDVYLHDSRGILPEPTETEPTMDFVIDIVHNIEELAELQKELTKWVRGKLRKDKLLEEIQDVKIAIENVEKWIDKL